MNRVSDLTKTMKICVGSLHGTKQALDSLRVNIYEMQLAGANINVAEDDIQKVTDQLDDIEKNLLRIYTTINSHNKARKPLMGFLNV